jgi:phage terminase large subunit-like protein
MTLAPPLTIAAGVHEYARSVARGDVVTGKLVRLACERHLRDLESGHERGIYFDEMSAEHGLRFFGFLVQTDGQWKGKPLELQGWQVFIIGSIFGWKREGGLRRFRTSYVEVARKNGKSLLGAGVGKYMAFFDGEGRAEVYSAATTRDQAKIVFEAAKRLQRTLPAELAEQVQPYAHSLLGEDGSTFKPLSSDYDSLDGLNVHCAVIDELHAHKNSHLVDVLETATGARAQPLMFYITTAGHDRKSACWAEHTYSEQVLGGVIGDDTYFAFIAAMDEGDDWQDEKVWIKSNPNLGVSVLLDGLRAEAAKAKASAVKQNAFRNKRLNEWTEQAVRWMDMEAWDACGAPIDMEELRGRPCFAGIDLSTKIDISAVELVFPPRDETEDWIVSSHFWVPKENIRKRSDNDRVPYDVWAREGYIHATEGNVVDFRAIRQEIKRLSEEDGLLIQQIGFDPWNATEFSTEMQEMGFKVIEVRQGARSLSEPMKLLEALVLQGKVRHGGHPVLRWMASNIAVRSDPNENIAPDKEKSSERIDGMVALVMAISRAIVERDDGPSVYESRGVITI